MNDELEQAFGERVIPGLDMERLDPRALFEDLLIQLREHCPEDKETIEFVQREYHYLGTDDRQERR